MKLLDRNFVKDLRSDGTFNESSFAREYESTWSGSSEDAFFSPHIIDKNRVSQLPEYTYSGKSAKGAYYIISVDVGRKGCSSIICVFKVTPQSQSAPIKSLVNIMTYEDEHFENQALYIKQTYEQYNARTVVVDGNGLGIGLVDYMIKDQICPDTNETYYNFGVENDEDGYYKKYKTNDTKEGAMYILKATAAINSVAHANVQSQLASSKIRLLIDEKDAKNKLLNSTQGKQMSAEKRADYLKPFTLTSILREEMLNLQEETSGANIILKPANSRIKKDKFSSFEYGLYYIKLEEDRIKKRKNFSVKDLMLMN